MQLQTDHNDPPAYSRHCETTIAQTLEKNNNLYPDKLALYTPERNMSWSELYDAVKHTKFIAQKTGIKKNTNVGILLNNSTDWVIWFYAIAAIGATVVPLNTKFKKSEIEYQLKDADVQTLIYTKELGDNNYDQILAEILPELKDHKPGIWTSNKLPLLKNVISVAGNTELNGAYIYTYEDIKRICSHIKFDDLEKLEESGINTNSPAIIQYTSGSTSFPKGVVLRHGSITNNAYQVSRRLDITHKDKIFNPGPLFHVGGSTLGLIIGLITGTPVYMVPRFDPAKILSIIEKHKITVYNGVDPLFTALLWHPEFTNEKFSTVIKGWIATSPDTIRLIKKEMNIPGLVNCYGLSEATPNVTVGSIYDDEETQVNNSGLPHPDCKIKIIDENGNELARNKPGEIIYKGYSTMLGYYNKPKETKKAIDANGWLHSGDLGAIDEKGYLTYLGRIKSILRVGGENVAPAEIEQVLLKHHSISQAAVFGVPDEKMTEVPVAVVEVTVGKKFNIDEIIEFCSKHLAKFKVPRRIAQIKEMPLTGSGKIDKKALIKFFE